MTFFWPHMLWFLLAAPLLVYLYILLLRRRQRSALRYAHLGMVRDAMSTGPTWRRHLPPLLFLLAFVVMTVAVARPGMYLTLPENRGTIMLAVDASASMLETDVAPNRLIAAQRAVREFIAEQPRNVRIGVVAFSANAMLLQAPTTDRSALLAAVDRIDTFPATAMGSGILASLAALFEGTEVALDLDQDLLFWNASELSSRARGDRPAAEPGSLASAAIIVLSDGASNRGPDPIQAAQLAADLGVRVYTVGLGDPRLSRFMPTHLRLDEPTLRDIADMTAAGYYPAGTEGELRAVYRELGTQLVTATAPTEVTAVFSALAGLLAFAAVLLSLLWFSRLF